MNTIAFLVAVIFGLMLAEQRISRRNEAALRQRGALEPPGDVYRWLAVLYPGAFLAMAIEGMWREAQAPSVTGGPAWAASGVVLFAAGKGLKYWAIRTLGHRWSFRVLVTPREPLVASGPYRYVAHPNYIAVVGELVGAAMMVGALVTGPVMSTAFGVALWFRVRFEEHALQAAGLWKGR